MKKTVRIIMLIMCAAIILFTFCGCEKNLSGEWKNQISDDNSVINYIIFKNSDLYENHLVLDGDDITIVSGKYEYKEKDNNSQSGVITVSQRKVSDEIKERLKRRFNSNKSDNKEYSVYEIDGNYIAIAVDIDENEADELQEGDRILYYSNNDDTFGKIISRTIRKKTVSNYYIGSKQVAGYITYNPETDINDKTLVEPSFIIGRYIGKIPFIKDYDEINLNYKIDSDELILERKEQKEVFVRG